MNPYNMENSYNTHMHVQQKTLPQTTCGVLREVRKQSPITAHMKKEISWSSISSYTTTQHNNKSQNVKEIRNGNYYRCKLVAKFRTLTSIYYTRPQAGSLYPLAVPLR
uniref:Uncharacterized protein n=1 Tax=Glossina pallidipes TaxID=7398 RepID=A0A1A9ZKQ2_GLOPL